MSCPDWNALVTLRERDGADPEGWPEALEHFDACRDCRDEALTADPVLVFRRLPALDLPAAAEASEVDSMRQAVSAMRTAQRLDSGRRFGGWRRWTAAAVLAGVSLSVSQDKAPHIELAGRAKAPDLAPVEQLSGPGRVVNVDREMSVVMVMGADV
jgi:hypothetical protein